MDRTTLALSTCCFLCGFVYSVYALRARVQRSSRLNFALIVAGFIGQTAFLFLRGEQRGRCPLTNLFEVLVFLCWSMVIFYLAIGPAYRLSLLGAFTSPLVFILQTGALLLPAGPVSRVAGPVNPWLELHAALSVMADGAFALAFVAGAMYLAQERQLKTHHLHSIFYRLPPIHDLAVADRRLILAGFSLFTVGLLAGFANGVAHLHLLRVAAYAIWLLYGAILVAVFWHRISPRHVAVLSVGAFAVTLLTLWAIHLAPTAPL